MEAERIAREEREAEEKRLDDEFRFLSPYNLICL
jgi:hypothetical protein